MQSSKCSRSYKRDNKRETDVDAESGRRAFFFLRADIQRMRLVCHTREGRAKGGCVCVCGTGRTVVPRVGVKSV